MSQPSKTYRVYWFDALLPKVDADSIEVASDAEAIALVEAGGYGSKCEIWDGRRLVAQLDGERRQA